MATFGAAASNANPNRSVEVVLLYSWFFREVLSYLTVDSVHVLLPLLFFRSLSV